MFIKKMIRLALFIPLSAIAQQTTDVQQKILPPIVPAYQNNNSPTPVTMDVVTAPVKATIISPGALTIQALSAMQAQEMTSTVAKQLGIAAPNTVPSQSAETLTKRRPMIVKPQTPNLESVVGPDGMEVASFRLNNGVIHSVKVGDFVEKWQIKQIFNGRVLLESAAISSKENKNYDKIKKVSTKKQWISVGEFLK